VEFEEANGLTTAEDIYEAGVQIRDGIRMAHSGRREEAVAALSSALGVVEDEPFGQLHLALALATEGRYEEAKPHVEKALELAPGRAAFHLFAGRVYFDACDYAAAGEAFGRAVELSPRNDLAVAYRTLNSWAAGDGEAALRLRPDALPDSAPFLARLLYAMESELNGRVVDYEDTSVSPRFLDGVRIGYWLWRAAGRRKAAEYQEALGLTDMVLELCPGHSPAVRFQRQCREAALAMAEHRVEETPDSADARVELATLLADAEKYEAAAEQLRSVEESASAKTGGKDEAGDGGALLETPWVSRLRGRTAYGLGDYEEALRLVKAGEEPGFSMVETWYMLGLCHERLGARRLSFEAFERLVEKVCWAVPLRLREYLWWRRSDDYLRRQCASGTSS